MSLAAQKGDITRVKQLLEDPDSDLNAVDPYGNTPLTWAARNGRVEIVRMMVKDKNKIDAENYRNAFFAATEAGRWRDGILVMKLLLATFNIDVNATDKNGSTALHLVTVSGNRDAVEFLLKTNGIDIKKKDKSDSTALDIALAKGEQHMVELLLPSIWDANLQNSIQEAARSGDHDLLDSLLAKSHRSGTLIRCNRLDLINVMMRLGTNLEQEGEYGQTALHVATEQGNLDIAKALMSAGADINAKDYSERTPLRTALIKGHIGVVRELLKRRASTTGIMSCEWHRIRILDEHKGELALLSEAFDGERHLDFLEAIYDFRSLFEKYPKRKTFPIPITSGMKSSVWTKVPFKISEKEELAANELRLDYKSQAWEPPVSIALWLPLDQFSSDRLSEHDGTQLCRRAGECLSQRRADQLTFRGKSAEMMDDLAKDAHKLAGLRLSLASQISKARELMEEIPEIKWGPYTTRRAVLKLLEEDFETGIKTKLDELDQIARDLLQIEFAWSSIREARTGTRLGQNVMLLTYVSIFYLPLGFCAALWAIPNITDSSTRLPFAFTALFISLLTLLVTFNMEIIAASLQKGYRYFKNLRLRDVLKGIQRKRRRGWRKPRRKDSREVGNQWSSEAGSQNSMPSV
ncbi:hypothetical protein TgHK011_006871 [Trichoderma gracile]|nr:hypothetical protein TgHK011_006871 [Trichoderma gracile]